MKEAYNLWVTTNTENSEMFKQPLVSDLQPFYEMLKNNPSWVSVGGGAYSSISGSSEDYLYVPKSGFLKFNFNKGSSLGTMIFSAVEELTLREMAEDIGIIDVEDKCIRKGMKFIYEE